MYRLIETIRLENGELLRIRDHASRVSRSIQAVYKTQPAWSFEQLVASQELPGEGCYKFRIVYDQHGATVNVTPYVIQPVHSLTLMENNDIHYEFKWEDRSAINQMMDRRLHRDDILIVKNGMITDVSYANIILSRRGEWFTPDTYLFNGIMRQQLLAKGKIREAAIRVTDLPKYEQFRLINAMIGEDGEASDVSNIE